LCYWQEKSHEHQPSDDYWAESTVTTSTTTSKEEIVVAVPTDDYWQWTTDVRTCNDQYWHWPAALPLFAHKKTTSCNWFRLHPLTYFVVPSPTAIQNNYIKPLQ